MFKKIIKTVILCSFIFILFNTSFASGIPKIIEVSVSGYFTEGSRFTIKGENFSKIKEDNKVFFNNLKAHISNSSEKQISGILPKGISVGDVFVKVKGIKSKTAKIDFPVINEIRADAFEKDALMTVNGRNFANNPSKNAVYFENNIKAPLVTSNQNQIIVKIPEKAKKGNVYVVANNKKSAFFNLNFSSPEIIFIYSITGIYPGEEIQIHGKDLYEPHKKTEVFLGKDHLVITHKERTMVKVKLPKKTLNQKIKLKKAGIASNELQLPLSVPVIVKSAVYDSAPNDLYTKEIHIYGINFGNSKSGVSVKAANKTLKIKDINNTLIRAEPPNIKEDSIVKVSISGVEGNPVKLHYPDTYKPVISSLSNLIRESKKDFNGNIKEKYFLEFNILNVSFDNKNDIKVYINNSSKNFSQTHQNKIKAEIGISFPSIGKIFATYKGYKSNTIKFDYSNYYTPIIYSIEAPYGFAPTKPIIIKGSNLGKGKEDRYNKKLTFSLSNGGLMKDKFNRVNIANYSPSEIKVFIGASAKIGKKTTLSVSSHGKKSNVVSFNLDPKIKNAHRAPEIIEISYPFGQSPGDKIIVKGAGFHHTASLNIIYFGKLKTTAEEVNSEQNKLKVIIPEQAVSSKLYVETFNQQSNKVDIEILRANVKKLFFNFSLTDKPAVSYAAKKEKILGKLDIQNSLGNVNIKKIVFDINYTDDPELDYSYENLGVLPFGEFTLADGKNKKISYSSLIEKKVLMGKSRYYIVFNDFDIPVKNTIQTIFLKTKLLSFIQNDSKISFSFTPSNKDYLEAYYSLNGKKIRNIQNETLKSFGVEIKNEPFTCIDKEKNYANCNKIFLKHIKKESKPSVQEKIKEKQPNAFSSPDMPKIKPGQDFYDIDKIPWAKIYIKNLKEKGIIKGYNDNTFRPEKEISRAEFLKIAIEAFNKNIDSILSQKSFFSDVNKNDWFFKYIMFAKLNNVVQGYKNKKMFLPNKSISRAEAVKILLSLKGIKPVHKKTSFVDVKDWQIPWVEEARILKIVDGINKTKFAPNNPLTRGAAAKIVSQILENKK